MIITMFYFTTSKACLSFSAGTGGNVDWLPSITTGWTDFDTSLTHSSTENTF